MLSCTLLMDDIGILKNHIQEYSWGSRTAIATLLGSSVPSSQPQAELWMGAHAKAPSQVYYEKKYHSLIELIQQYPVQILGDHSASRFGNKLPFLFKILAADQPLSIQAHPDLAQAQAGFAKENALGIPLTDCHRNYKDANHKPEIICALSPFWALSGFRPIHEILEHLKQLSSSALQPVEETLTAQPNAIGLKACFEQILTMPNNKLEHAVLETVAFAHAQGDKNPLFRWLVRLNELHPGDVGVLFAILLNLIHLHPGEAIFLPVGQLHAYLDGTGVELMANSDNVLRGGLTVKHIDTQELLKIVTFEAATISKIAPVQASQSEQVYRTPAEEFLLSKISVDKKRVYNSGDDRSVELLICVSGKAKVRNSANETVTALNPGVSVIIPASVKRYRIIGNATLFKATVPSG